MGARSRYVLVACALSMLACSGGARGFDGSAALLERAAALRSTGDEEGAVAALLECFEWCEEAYRPRAARDLRGAAAASPAVDTAVWEVVARVERRSMAPDRTDEQVVSDIVALAAVYREWRAEARAQSQLIRAHKHGRPDRGQLIVAQLSVNAPRLMRTLTDDDAAHLVRIVSTAPAEDVRLAAMVPDDPQAGAALEELRIANAVRYAVALLSSQRRDAAQEVIRLVLAGVPVSGCEKLGVAVASEELQGLNELACAGCSELNVCARDSSARHSPHE